MPTLCAQPLLYWCVMCDMPSLCRYNHLKDAAREVQGQMDRLRDPLQLNLPTPPPKQLQQESWNESQLEQIVIFIAVYYGSIVHWEYLVQGFLSRCAGRGCGCGFLFSGRGVVSFPDDPNPAKPFFDFVCYSEFWRPCWAGEGYNRLKNQVSIRVDRKNNLSHCPCTIRRVYPVFMAWKML